MPIRTRNAVTLGAVFGLAAAWSGCESAKQTEYVAGISTQVQVPRDLKTVRIDVSVGGIPAFCRAYRVYDGRVQLPRSLGSLPVNEGRVGEPISVTVVGFTEDISDDSRINEFDCLKMIAAGDNARILRRSRQPYVKDQILFLPMALRYSCFDKDCETAGQDRSCKAGRCVDAVIDEKTLPIFDEDLIDGSGGNCFHASECFAPAVPPVTVNPDDCTYALPNTPSAPPPPEGLPPNPITTVGDGVNVEVVYDGGFTREILDRDDEEGFSIPDPAMPQRFRLAPGLCDLVKGTDDQGVPTKHRITAIRATGLCQAKGKFQPLCTSDQLNAMNVDESGISPNPEATACKPTLLSPPKAALIVLADDTHNSDLFYSQAGQATMNLSLSDPAFEQTEIGLSFFPGTGGTGATCGPDGSFSLAVPVVPAKQAKTEVLNAFVARDPSVPANASALKPIDTAVHLDGALRDAYATLGAEQYASYYRRAVLVLGNRGFDSNTCGGGGTAARAAAALAGSNVETYVLMLARDLQLPNDVPLPGSYELAIAGGTETAYDARAAKSEAQRAFQNIVNDIATCVYDVASASARPTAGDALSYSDPVNNVNQVVPYDAACTSASASASGWGLDPSNDKRIFVCGDACTTFRNTLSTAAQYAALNLQPNYAIPMFAHKPGCAPLAGVHGAGTNVGADAGVSADGGSSIDSGSTGAPDASSSSDGGAPDGSTGGPDASAQADAAP